MGRPKLPAGQKRIQMSVRLRPTIAAWVQGKVEQGVFKDATHAVEFALRHLMNSEAPDGSLVLTTPGKKLLQAAASRDAGGDEAKSSSESTKRR